MHSAAVFLIIIIMEICKAPTLRLKVLNKHTHIMYIKMENVVQKINVYYIYRQVFKHNYAKDARTHTHTLARTHAHTHAHARARARTHTHTHTLYRLMGVKDNVTLQTETHRQKDRQTEFSFSLQFFEKNQHTRELISARKTSHKHNSEDPSRLR